MKCYTYKLNRREFLKRSAVAAAGIAAGTITRSVHAKANSRIGVRQKKIVVIGIDGMDPSLCETMMKAGQLPSLKKFRDMGGYRRLGTSAPPQSPVAWANFINGSGPASHGIFDFIHRDPSKQCAPVFSLTETVPGTGSLTWDNHKVPLEFWPFNHKSPTTILKRRGIPFWHYLDEAGIQSAFYDLPSNYPPSPSIKGNHKCLSGMGTPDMLGTYGTYQHFAENGPLSPLDEQGGRRSRLSFQNDTATAKLIGPQDQFLSKTQPAFIEFQVHRDRQACAAVIDLPGKRILLREKEWSHWTPLRFALSMPRPLPDKRVNGMCRFYLQEVAPNFRLYATPINIDPSDPAVQIAEPADFTSDISDKLGRFYTTGFQEDHKALSNGVFTDDEFVDQANYVLKERLQLLQYAQENYDSGLLFFYFSSVDLQSHMLWWDSKDKHPIRSHANAQKYFGVLKDLYRKLDRVVGDIDRQYGDQASIIVMSDHGFARFQRQFSLNTWLRDNGYLISGYAESIFQDVDWTSTRAYGLGINSLYLNLRGREKYGIVADGEERDNLLNELIVKLEKVQDIRKQRVIQKVYRTDKIYPGAPPQSTPDLIIGYNTPYRASWDTCLGGISNNVLMDNNSAWSADHCADPSQLSGILFCNRSLAQNNPSLTDIGPTILSEFGLPIPARMEGRNIF
ncbi:MAG: alkaline phosphatase family protein [Lentisphaerae bacterium]|nr:alkaline phosphatase family protein [Lentisphaerota bacterium]